MRKSVAALALSAAIVAGAAPSSQAVQPHDHDALPLLDARGAGAAPTGAQADAGRSDRLLTGRSKDLPREIVLDYVRDHRDRFGLDAAGVAQLQLVARAVSPDGIVHLRFNQVLDGVLSFDRGIDGHVTADGRLITISGAPLPGARLPDADPQLGKAAGVAAATDALGPGADGDHAALRWTADRKGRARLVWEVTADDGDGLLYSLLVDADDGALLRRQSLSHDLGQARWFRADPLTTPAQTQITMPPAWYDDSNGGTRLWGQYARTYVDRQDSDPAYGAEGGPTLTQIPASNAGALDWLYAPVEFPAAAPCPQGAPCTWDSSDVATAATNQFQAATNAHVLASRFHDHLLAAPIGFDEASGNFQVTNRSGQGRGGDPVRVEVNDGQGLNNANFGTPPDGQAPRMQMFLWTIRDVNGSDAADVVYHEYGHGLSNRLVVNASGGSTLSAAQSLMMGEAWSDFYAFDLLVGEGDLADTAAPAELALAAYVAGRGIIRAKPIDCPVAEAGVTDCDGFYAGRPQVLGGYTYGDLARTDNSSPHNGGEVWGETLWELRRAVGREAALALVTGGMRLAPDAPSMLDMRDAILQQALAMRSAPGAADDHWARTWTVFAARGFGASATTPDANSTAPAEAFDLPSGVSAGTPTISDPYPGGDDDGVVEPGEQVELSWPLASRGLVDLPGVTATLTGAPALTIVDGRAAWPLLGNARTAANADPLVVRVPAGQCSTAYPVSLAIATTEGAATGSATVDPRPGQRAVLAIQDGGGADAQMIVGGSGDVTDVDVRIDELRHTYVGDLKVELLHDGVTVTLVDRLNSGGGPGSYGGQDILGAIVDSDAAAGPVLVPGGPIGGRFQPTTSNALDAFDGHPVAGAWTLRISDNAAGDVGELRRWGIDSPQQACGRLEIPAAATGAAAVGGSTSATVDGAVTPNGRATGLRFAWGTTSGYGAVTPVEPLGAGDGAVARAASLSGLAAGTTYHYRVEAIRDGKLAVAGEDRTFTTAAAVVPPPPPGGGGGGGGGGGTPPPTTPVAPPVGPPAADTVAPVLSRTSVRLARVARRGGVRRRATVAFTLSEAATVTAVATARAAGIKRGKACVAVPKKRPRGAKPCTRTITATRATVRAVAGAGTLRLPGVLPKGTWTVTLTAVDAAGNRAKAVTVRVTVR